MNVSMKYLLSLAAISLAVSSTAARADTINFSSPAIPTDIPLVTYTTTAFADGVQYIITNTGSIPWEENVNQGNPPPGLNTFSNTTGAGSTLTVQEVGGGAFIFNSFDVGAYLANVNYTISGSYLGTSEFTASGVDTRLNPPVGSGAKYITYSAAGITTMNGDVAAIVGSGLGGSSSGNFGAAITKLTITESAVAQQQYAVDNISLTPTPEPSSLILAGSGLLGLAASIRRRLAV